MTAGLAIALALILSPRIGPLDRALLARLDLERAAAADLAALEPAMEEALAGIPGIRDRPADVHPLTRPTDRAVLIAPARLVPAIATQLDLPLDRITFLRPELLTGEGPAPGTVWLVYHERGLDLPEDAYGAIESGAEATVGRLSLAPLGSVAGRAWLVAVRAAP